MCVIREQTQYEFYWYFNSKVSNSALISIFLCQIVSLKCKPKTKPEVRVTPQPK